MTAIIPALAKATCFGVALGGGAALILPYDKKHAKLPVFALITVASIALRAVAWYFGIAAACGAAIGIPLGMYIQQNDTSTESIAGGALFGAAIGYFIGLPFRS